MSATTTDAKSATTTTKEYGTKRGFYNCPETPEPVSLKVVGDFPTWISGALYRTGPGTYSVPKEDGTGTFEIRHWFDGFTLHHRFEIEGGKVSYRSRNGAKAREEFVAKTGTLPPDGSFGQEDPCATILGKFFTKFVANPVRNYNVPLPTGPTSQNIGVTLTPGFRGFASEYEPSGDTFVAKTDYNGLQVLDRVTLEPLAVRTYGELHEELNGPLAAAHAAVGDGEFYNYTMAFGTTPVYKIFKIDRAGKVHILATITDAPSAYIHQVFLTKKYFILVVWQCDFKMGGLPVLASSSVSVNTFSPWSDSRKTLFYVVDRQEGGVVGRYESDTFFAFHSINAYDDNDGSIVLDIAVYPDNSIIERLTLENLRNDISTLPITGALDATPRRFRLPLPTTANSNSNQYTPVKHEFDYGSSFNIELPVVAPSKVNAKHRYAYGVHWEMNGKPAEALANAVIKVDYEKGEKKLWSAGRGVVPGEPVFVGRPGAEGEDDGVLLTVVLDGEKGTSALVVIDARTMREVARAEMEVPVPFGFHGAFDERH